MTASDKRVAQHGRWTRDSPRKLGSASTARAPADAVTAAVAGGAILDHARRDAAEPAPVAGSASQPMKQLSFVIIRH